MTKCPMCDTKMKEEFYDTLSDEDAKKKIAERFSDGRKIK